MHPRAKVSPETCKFRRHGCPLAKSCQCQTHSINLHVRGVSDVARTVIRSNTCMDETDEAAGRGSEAEKPPGADLPSIARGATPGHERDTARAMELRAASKRRADHLVTQKPLAGPLGTHTPRPIRYSHLTKRPAVARATAGKVLAAGCARQGQSTRRGLSSPSMRGITSTTWSIDRATWPSSSSSWQRRCHLRPSRPDWP